MIQGRILASGQVGLTPLSRYENRSNKCSPAERSFSCDLILLEMFGGVVNFPHTSAVRLVFICHSPSILSWTSPTHRPHSLATVIMNGRPCCA